MASPDPDPYRTLNVAPDVGDDELRGAYRRLAMLHHPDHNGGSPEAARRFAEIQEAYAHVRLLRRTAARPAAGVDPDLETRIAEMEAELHRARAVREQATRRAARFTRSASAPRASDAELGYISTDDSFTRILDDFADDVSRQVTAERPSSEPPSSERPRSRPRSVSEWIDELGSRLTGEDRRR